MENSINIVILLLCELCEKTFAVKNHKDFTVTVFCSAGPEAKRPLFPTPPGSYIR